MYVVGNVQEAFRVQQGGVRENQKMSDKKIEKKIKKR
ncbi:hypothetical protein GKR41_00507 [Candidatus Vallotia lariciata]|nr:hypothetical protein GKR41_00507 [Candidatus Vallotia lariciata]